MSKLKKPPLGLKPKRFATFDEDRVVDILAAIGRYSLAEKPIPILWVEELNSIVWRYITKNNTQKG